MGIPQQIRRLVRHTGYDIVRFTPASHPVARKIQMLKTYGVDTVLDVGANLGQYGEHVRKDLGFDGRIVSFEPLSAAFAVLKSNAASDRGWDVFHCALGETSGSQQINISSNSVSSSLLQMLPSHLESAPESLYVGMETIQVNTLDAMFADVCKAARHIYLKIDTQGFEGQVLRGAEQSLRRIDTIEIEMSLMPLYAGGLLFDDICSLMKDKGYTLVALENGFADAGSGQVLQVDGVFHRFAG